MASEQELKNNSPLQKEFQNLLEKDFKDRKLKENEIIKATVTEITKNFVVVDCKAKRCKKSAKNKKFIGHEKEKLPFT